MPPILQVLVVLLPLFLLGFLLCKSLDPGVNGLEGLAMAFPMGGGLLTLATFLASWMGMRLDRLGISIVYSILVISLAGVYLLRRRRAFGRPEISWRGRAGRSCSIRDYLYSGVFLALALLAAYLAVGRSYSTWDAIAIWGIKGYAIAREGTFLAAGEWGSHGLSYPLNIPLQISFFSIWGSDSMPTSKLIFPAFYFSLLLRAYAFHRQRLGMAPAFMAALALGTLPVVFEHATMGYANLPFATYIVFGVLALYEGSKMGSRSGLHLGGILLGMAVWTRPEGLMLTSMIWLAFMGASLATRSDAAPRRLAGSLALFLLTSLPWQLFLREYGLHPLIRQAPSAAITAILQGNFHLEGFYWIFRFLAGQALNPGVWGVFVPLSLIMLVASYRKIKETAFRSTAVLSVLLVTIGLSLVGYYYLVSFVGDLKFWLGSGVNRMFLPAGILAAIWVFHLAGWMDGSQMTGPATARKS